MPKHTVPKLHFLSWVNRIFIFFSFLACKFRVIFKVPKNHFFLIEFLEQKCNLVTVCHGHHLRVVRILRNKRILEVRARLKNLENPELVFATLVGIVGCFG